MAQGKFNEDEKEEATAMRKMEIRCKRKCIGLLKPIIQLKQRFVGPNCTSPAVNVLRICEMTPELYYH